MRVVPSLDLRAVAVKIGLISAPLPAMAAGQDHDQAQRRRLARERSRTLHQIAVLYSGVSFFVAGLFTLRVFRMLGPGDKDRLTLS